MVGLRGVTLFDCCMKEADVPFYPVVEFVGTFSFDVLIAHLGAFMVAHTAMALACQGVFSRARRHLLTFRSRLEGAS